MRQTVIYLKKDELEVFRVEEGVKTANAKTVWDPVELVNKLKMVKEKFETESVRVLVAREIAGTEMVLDQLSKAALEAKLTIEMVEPESLEEGEGDKVVELAEKEIDHKPSEAVVVGANVAGPHSSEVNVAGEVKMATEIMPEEESKPEPVAEAGGLSGVSPVSITPSPTIKPVVSVGKRLVKRDLKWVWVGLLALGVLGGVGGVVAWGKARKAREPVSETVTPQIVMSSPSPTPSPEPLVLSELAVQILNGAGVVGEAGRARTALVAAGFDEAKIEAGNADNYDYVKTEVRRKKGVSEEVVEEIVKAMGEKYQVVAGEELSDDSEYDVVLVVGVREGAAVKATPTPKPASSASPAASVSADLEATESGDLPTQVGTE